MLTRLVQEDDAGKAKYSLQKEANLIKYTKQETDAQNIKNQLKSCTKMRIQKNSKANKCMDKSSGTLKDHQ